MDGKSNKSFIIFLGVFILASVVRFVFNSTTYILNIIAGINIIAFWYVCYLIIDSVKNTFYDKLSKIEHLGESVQIKMKKYFTKHIRFCEIFILIIGLLYVILLANSIVNDIISLCALFLSIETHHVCTYILSYFLKKK